MICKCGNKAMYVHPLEDTVYECLACSDKTMDRLKTEYKNSKQLRTVDEDVMHVASVTVVESVSDFEMLAEKLIRGQGSFSERCNLMYNFLQIKQHGNSEFGEPLAV